MFFYLDDLMTPTHTFAPLTPQWVTPALAQQYLEASNPKLSLNDVSRVELYTQKIREDFGSLFAVQPQALGNSTG